jgi:hypothetical protein
VNIVGFALDDEELKRTFRRWARIGNGTYFDATNAEELDRAVAAAAAAPYAIYDAEGTEVATGTVGGRAIALRPGAYTLVVFTEPAWSTGFRVEAGETTTVEVTPESG